MADAGGEPITVWSPAVPTLWAASDVSWEAQQKVMGSSCRLRLASQINVIPAVIRVLWLMFDEQGDRLSGCFHHACTSVSCVIRSAKQDFFFFKESGQCSPLGAFSFLHYQYPQVRSVFSSQVVFHVFFLPVRVVSARKETTVYSQ